MGRAPEIAPVEADAGLAPAARRRRLRTVRWSPKVALAAVITAVLAGQGVALAIVAAAGGDDAGGLALAGALLAADAVTLAVVLFAATRDGERVGAATFGLRRTPLWSAVGWALAIWIGALAVQGVTALISGEDGSSGGSAFDTEGALVILLVVLGIAVTAPIVEEISFRGYLFPALTTWRGPWVAAALSGALFGVAHYAALPTAFLPAIALFGFGIALLFWFTRSLLPCIGLHALNNGLVVAVAAGCTWQVPLVALGAVVVSLVAVAPFTAQRAEAGA